MNRIEFEELLDDVLAEIAPNYKLLIDRKGKLVIHTNLSEDEDGDLFQDLEDEEGIVIDDGEIDGLEDLIGLDGVVEDV